VRPESSPDAAPTLDAEGFVRVGANRLRFLRDGAAAFPAMLAAIADARDEVLLEMYWIGADRMGERFRRALVERAAAGVPVRVVYDAIGSLATPAAFWTPLVEAGAQVFEYSPISPFKGPFRFQKIVHRDHRKLLVVDGQVAFVGGINIGDQWSPVDSPESAWRDDGVEVRGPASSGLRAAFYRVWRRLGGMIPGDARGTRAELDPGVRVLTNRSGPRSTDSIVRTYLTAIRRATESIDIASAYFLPGPRFLHALRSAARRRVHIRVLVPERSDIRVVGMAMSSLYGRLLGDGVDLYAYEPRVLHCKTAVFDQHLTIIGSHNLDAASMRFNLECDVAIESSAFAGIVRRSFERDLGEARKLDLASWRRRPPWLRAVGWVAALFERLL
jgi:cardiolipin synthase A/B